MDMDGAWIMSLSRDLAMRASRKSGGQQLHLETHAGKDFVGSKVMANSKSPASPRVLQPGRCLCFLADGVCYEFLHLMSHLDRAPWHAASFCCAGYFFFFFFLHIP